MKKSIILLLTLSLLVAGLWSNGNDEKESSTSAPSTMDSGAVKSEKYGEAPMLAELVKAGSLAIVEERLPEDPMVLEPHENNGQFGGTWHLQDGDASTLHSYGLINYDGLIRWNRDLSGYEANLAEYEYNADGTELTFFLRKGIKWSDGTEFTTADIEFWFNDIATNDDFKFISIPGWLRNKDRSVPEMSFPDPYTWVIKMKDPAWNLVYRFALGGGTNTQQYMQLLLPSHYLKQFHPAYASGAEYTQLEEKIKFWMNPDYPVIWAWKTKTWKSDHVVLERNPYYWKVDPDGNQLPYMDHIDFTINKDPQVAILNASSGKYDADFRFSNEISQLPFMMERQESEGYTMLTGIMAGTSAQFNYMVNQDYHSDVSYNNDEAGIPAIDKEIRDLLRDKNVRRGLSVAMNRADIVDKVFLGLSEPGTYGPSPVAFPFNGPEGDALRKRVNEMWGVFDPEKSLSYFDAAGFKDYDGDGWRDLPSGKAFELIIDVTNWGGTDQNVAGAEIYKQNLEDVGVKVILNNLVGNPAAKTRQKEGLFMLTNVGAADVDVFVNPVNLMPISTPREWPMASKYISSGGTDGWELSSTTQKLVDYYYEMIQSPSTEERKDIILKAAEVRFIEEGPFRISASSDVPTLALKMNYMKNIPNQGYLASWWFGIPGSLHPEQFYIDRAEYDAWMK